MNIFLSISYAAPIPPKNISEQQLIREQERQKALKAALDPSSPDIRLLPSIAKSDILHFPEESLCFPIHHVELLGRKTIPYIVPLYPLSQQAHGQCLGAQGVNLLMSAIQNQLISYGYLTTRVVAPEQNLTSGTLQLLLVKGTVRNLYYADGSDTHAKLSTAMPIKSGDILNLRDIEQGLENLQRIPTVTAQMQIVPGDNPGESDIQITRTQSKYWRLGLSIDDSGTKSTGRYQGGATFYLDNPLGMSDSFYLSGGHDLNKNSQYGSKNYLISYSVPFGYWLWSANISGNDYHQTVAGIPTDYEYSGKSKNMALQVSRVIHRNENQKTTLSYGVTLRESHNYINDTEIDIQHRKTTNWTLGLQHRHYFNHFTLDVDVNYRKGVRWFGAEAAPEETSGDGTALSEIFSWNIGLSAPFSLSEQAFRYNLTYQGQQSWQGKLTSQDRFSIGSRWSVRGFDGELTLSADNGWFIRNELSWSAPFEQELYAGVDFGEVSGANSGYLLGKQLAGSAIGVRGSIQGFYYDAFASTPIYKPKGFKTNRFSLGFSVNWNY